MNRESWRNSINESWIIGRKISGNHELSYWKDSASTPEKEFYFKEGQMGEICGGEDARRRNTAGCTDDVVSLRLMKWIHEIHTPRSRKTRSLKNNRRNRHFVQFQIFFCSLQFFVCWNWCLAFLALWLSGNTITELTPLLFLLKLWTTIWFCCLFLGFRFFSLSKTEQNMFEFRFEILHLELTDDITWKQPVAKWTLKRMLLVNASKKVAKLEIWHDWNWQVHILITSLAARSRPGTILNTLTVKYKQNKQSSRERQTDQETFFPISPQVYNISK